MTRKARKAQSKGRAAHTSGKAALPEPTTFTEAFKRLNPKRRKFVATYLLRPNATYAAKEAGYSPDTARSQGQRLLTFDDIRAALRLGWSESGMSAQEVRARTEDVVRASIEDFFTFDLAQVHPHTHRPVSELLTELFQEIELEDRWATRADLNEKELVAHEKAQIRRKRDALRMEMEMERNPHATRWVPGPPVMREVERLDLAKARDLGVLHLLKSIKYTQHGPAIELESREHARDQIGKLHGMWGKDDDKPTVGEGLPPTTQLEDASDDQLQSELLRLLGASA